MRSRLALKRVGACFQTLTTALTKRTKRSICRPSEPSTWFHTGAWLDHKRLERELANEYYDNDPDAPLLLDPGLPGEMSAREEREAARALRGKILRQEVYSDDGTSDAKHPYSVSERNYELRLIQRAGRDNGAIFFAHARETIDLLYERNPSDPRMRHELSLEVDEFGNVIQSATIAYPRRVPHRLAEEDAMGRRLGEQARLWAYCLPCLLYKQAR